jgi:phospholipid/cholesterol/gamma-HCH transport system substrate-binding protein
MQHDKEHHQPAESSTTAPTSASLQFRAALLLVTMVALVLSAALYVMYARGAFEAKQTLYLVADDAEGISVGMDLTFAGFPIGRVSRIELTKEGSAQMIINVPTKDAHWLRTTSIFTLERGLVGGAKLRAYSGILTDPALEDGAERKLLVGDASSEIPKLVATAKELLENIKALTAADSSLDASLGNVKTLTAKMNAKHGALGALMGDEQNVQKLLQALDRTNSLLAKVDTLAAKTDTQVFGPEGVMKDAQKTVRELNALLAETRGSLKKLDAVLIEAQGVGANVKAGTADLGALRNDVEANLRKIDLLINDLNRRWPFKRDAEIKLP